MDDRLDSTPTSWDDLTPAQQAFAAGNGCQPGYVSCFGNAVYLYAERPDETVRFLVASRGDLLDIARWSRPWQRQPPISRAGLAPKRTG